MTNNFFSGTISGRRLLVLILALIILVRALHFYSTLADPYVNTRVGDELEYHQWAQRIAEGQILRERAFFTSPLYAYVLGALYSLRAPELPDIRLLNLLLGIGTLVLMYRTAVILYSPTISLLSLILSGFCIAPMFYESFAEKTSLVLFLTALSVFLVMRSSQQSRPWLWLLSGIAAGVAALGHALFIVFLPAACMHILFRYRSERRFLLKAAGLFLAGCACALFPSVLHNYLVDKDFVLVSYNGGQNFYAGNNLKNPTGTYSAPPFFTANLRYEEAEYLNEAQRRTGRTMKPSEVSRYWFRRGLNDISADPWLFARHFIQRLRWTFHAAEQTDTRSFQFYEHRLPVLGFPFWNFGWVSLFGLTGMLLSIRDRRFVFLNLLILCYALLLSCFFVYGRYRLPLLVPLSLLSGIAFIKARELLQQRQAFTGARALGLAGIAAMAFWTLAPHKTGADDAFLEYYNYATVLSEKGEKDPALAEYEKALRENPRHVYVDRAVQDMVDIYIQQDREAQAESLLDRVSSGGVDSPFLLGARCLVETNKVLKAKPGDGNRLRSAQQTCRRALQLKPDAYGPLLNLAALYILDRDLARAEDTFQEALGRFPSDPHLLKRVSIFYYEYLGDSVKAAAYAEHAAGLDPQDGSITGWRDSLRKLPASR